MRMRMPLAMAGAAALPVAAAVDRPAVWWAAVALFAVGTAFYTRAGTPHGPPVDIGPPVRGHWTAVNSPTSRVPSHGVHVWAQTYGLDLVHDPGGRGEAPGGLVADRSASRRLPGIRQAGVRPGLR